jgi:hypothetical protein
MSTTSIYRNTPRYHLIPVEHEWGVRREGGRVYECICEDRQAALREAKRIAYEKKAILVLHDQVGRAGASMDFSVESASEAPAPGNSRAFMSIEYVIDLATD